MPGIVKSSVRSISSLSRSLETNESVSGVLTEVSIYFSIDSLVKFTICNISKVIRIGKYLRYLGSSSVLCNFP